MTRKSIIKFISNNEDVNIQKKDGNTALILASCKGDIVELLLNKQADVNIQNKNGDTALMVECEYGHTKIVKLFLKKNPNVDLKNRKGYTALDIARRKCYYDIIKLLTPSLFPYKRRLTTDWMEICDNLGQSGVDELRNIVIDHVTSTNFSQIKLHFAYDGPHVNAFKYYVNNISKRQLCVALAKYYEAAKPTYQRDCQNSETIGGDDVSELPPERLIVLTEGGRDFCFDVLEVKDLNGKNPYTNKPLPKAFV